MFITAIPIMAFSDEVVVDNGPLGVVTDADGNVVEVIKMSRLTYVDSVITIPANGKFTSYQYAPKTGMYMGVKFHDDNGNVVATRNATVKIVMYGSNEIGGTRESVDERKFSTNYEDNINNGNLVYYDFIGITVRAIEPFDYTYYNGVCYNMSSKAISVRIIITMG